MRSSGQSLLIIIGQFGPITKHLVHLFCNFVSESSLQQILLRLAMQLNNGMMRPLS